MQVWRLNWAGWYSLDSLSWWISAFAQTARDQCWICNSSYFSLGECNVWLLSVARWLYEKQCKTCGRYITGKQDDSAVRFWVSASWMWRKLGCGQDQSTDFLILLPCSLKKHKHFRTQGFECKSLFINDVDHPLICKAHFPKLSASGPRNLSSICTSALVQHWETSMTRQTAVALPSPENWRSLSERRRV